MTSIYRSLSLLVILSISIAAGACAPRRTKTTLDRVYELDPSGKLFISTQFRTSPPESLAVLPFRSFVGEGRAMGSEEVLLSFRSKDEASPEQLAQDMRLAFFGQLSLLPYHQLHPTRIDSLLNARGLKSWEDIRALPPAELRNLFNVDAVIFGEVTHLDYYYGFLYAQLAAGLRLEMISTITGEVLWRFRDTRRDHTIRIALDPISLAVGMFQAGFALRPINMTRAMDEICREAVAHLPPPQ